jgi:hypothetical protein
MGTDTQYEIWLPGAERPEEVHFDGDKAAVRSRELGGIWVRKGTSEEDRQTLFDAKFPPAAPVTTIPAGLEIAMSQARDRANREALDAHFHDEAFTKGKDSLPKVVAKAQKDAARGQKEAEERAEAHSEALRISLEEPERDAGGKPQELPSGTEIERGEVTSTQPPAVTSTTPSSSGGQDSQ